MQINTSTHLSICHLLLFSSISAAPISKGLANPTYFLNYAINSPNAIHTTVQGIPWNPLIGPHWCQQDFCPSLFALSSLWLAWAPLRLRCEARQAEVDPLQQHGLCCSVMPIRIDKHSSSKTELDMIIPGLSIWQGVPDVRAVCIGPVSNADCTRAILAASWLQSWGNMVWKLALMLGLIYDYCLIKHLVNPHEMSPLQIALCYLLID